MDGFIWKQVGDFFVGDGYLDDIERPHSVNGICYYSALAAREILKKQVIKPPNYRNWQTFNIPQDCSYGYINAQTGLLINATRCYVFGSLEGPLDIAVTCFYYNQKNGWNKQDLSPMIRLPLVLPHKIVDSKHITLIK